MSKLRRDLTKLSNNVPEIRRHLVPLLRKTSSSSSELKGIPYESFLSEFLTRLEKEISQKLRTKLVFRVFPWTPNKERVSISINDTDKRLKGYFEINTRKPKKGRIFMSVLSFLDPFQTSQIEHTEGKFFQYRKNEAPLIKDLISGFLNLYKISASKAQRDLDEMIKNRNH